MASTKYKILSWTKLRTSFFIYFVICNQPVDKNTEAWFPKLAMLFYARQIIASLALVALTLPLGVAGLKIREELAPELRGKRSFEERDGVKHTLFKHDATGATLDFVTNSGICETTPGVNQYSGYVNFGSKYQAHS